MVPRVRNWDWSKTNSELARKYNLSRERVRQIRKYWNKPKAVRILKTDRVRQKNGITFIKRRKSKYNWDQVDWNKSNVQIARELGCGYYTVSAYRYRNKKPISPLFKGIGRRNP